MKCIYCNKEFEPKNTLKKCCETCFKTYIAPVRTKKAVTLPSGKTVTVTRKVK